jgi:putative hydrolase of the HAD superfamily
MIELQGMSYRAVIFDLFGTLVDDFVAATGSMNAELLAALDVPHEPFMQHWRHTSEMRTIGKFQTVEASIEHVCNTIGTPVTAEQIANAVEIRLKYIGRALEPRADALPTLQRLKNDGRKIGLLSNCSIEIPILWPETPFADFFDSTVFSSRERLKKPEPKIYQLACERLGLPPEACLYVADGENFELAASAQAGLHPVLLHNPTRDNGKEVFREAREWRGKAVAALPEVLTLVGAEKVA